MRNIINIFWTIIILTLIISCGGEHTNNNKPTKQETPNALQDDKLDIKSYSRSNDLTEELYQELVDKTPELKNIENEFDIISSKPNDLKDMINHYDIKSNNYYSSANLKATAIIDSLLRMKIISLINSSSKRYITKKAELNSILNQINNNGVTLNDHHNVLKIVLTIPIIEKFQDDNKPDKQEFKNLEKEQEKLILKTDSLTPKY